MQSHHAFKYNRLRAKLTLRVNFSSLFSITHSRLSGSRLKHLKVNRHIRSKELINKGIGAREIGSRLREVMTLVVLGPVGCRPIVGRSVTVGVEGKE